LVKPEGWIAEKGNPHLGPGGQPSVTNKRFVEEKKIPGQKKINPSDWCFGGGKETGIKVR